MAHVQKFTMAAVGHMFHHYDRTAENIGNENVNRDESFRNYNLAQNQNLSQLDFLKKRLSEVKCQKRKDLNVFCDWVVTAPQNLDPEISYRAFFKSAYEFLSKEYGEKNVISAYVHMDEKQPHMHFAFIPVVKAIKKSKTLSEGVIEFEKVSAKEVLTRNHLKSFHSDLERHLEQSLGKKVDILNEATREGNKSIEELKRKSATERVNEANEKAFKIVSKAKTQVESMNDKLIAANAEYQAKKAYIRQADEVSNYSEMYPEQVKVIEKGLFNKQKFVVVPQEMWEAKYVSFSEKQRLHDAKRELEARIKEFRPTNLSKKINELSEKCKKLEKDNLDLKVENIRLESRLDEALEKVNKVMEKVNRVIKSLPLAIAEAFKKAWDLDNQKKIDREDRGRSR